MKKKREQGVLTIEASLVLSVITLLILFLFSFSRVYRAQSVVSHAVLQATDAVALESYLRETAFDGDAAKITELAGKISGSTTMSADNFKSLRSASLPEVAAEKFSLALSNTDAEAGKILKSLGVKDGLAGVNFATSHIDLDNNDVIVYADYVIEMQFPVFGLSEFKVSKSAKAKTFGEILFEIQTIPEDPDMGTASGGGNYKHGSKIQISATPNYGYKFVKWADGNTQNPRTVTVAGAKTYVAVFTEDQFGVTLDASPSSGGTVSGAGTYNYKSTANLTATAKAGYSFDYWSIYGHKTESLTTVKTASTPLKIDQSYTGTAYFKKNSYKITVKAQGAPTDGTKVHYGGRSDTSLSIPYLSAFTLTTPQYGGYRFVGWKKEGSGSYISTSYSLSNQTVPAYNVTYVAVYEIKPSISLSGGGTGGNSTTFKANTVPSDVTVSWSSSNSGVASVNNGNVTAKYTGSTTITASFVYNGKTYSASKNVAVKPSIELEYYTRRDGFCSYDASKCSYGPWWWKSSSGKRYVNTLSPVLGMRFYYDYDPGPNELDPKYGNHSKGVFHGLLNVTWSQINGAKKVDVQKKLTKAMIVHDTATVGPHAGKVNPQIGYNAGTKAAYIFYDGVYDSLWFIKSYNAPKPGGGYYDYYICSIY